MNDENPMDPEWKKHSPNHPFSPLPENQLTEVSEDSLTEEDCDEVTEDEGDDATELADWRECLLQDVNEALAEIGEIPALEESEDSEEELPDMYSFYSQLAVLAVDSRKGNRRTAEAINQWGEILQKFDASIAPLRLEIARLTEIRATTGLPDNQCLILIGMLDRMERIASAFVSTPPKKEGWWQRSNDDAWLKMQETQRQGMRILIDHLTELLRKEGVIRLEVQEKPFDPSVMNAVAVETTDVRPVRTVCEELAAGYLRHDKLLRPAQVKITAPVGVKS